MPSIFRSGYIAQLLLKMPFLKVATLLNHLRNLEVTGSSIVSRIGFLKVADNLAIKVVAPKEINNFVVGDFFI